MNPPAFDEWWTANQHMSPTPADHADVTAAARAAWDAAREWCCEVTAGRLLRVPAVLAGVGRETLRVREVCGLEVIAAIRLGKAEPPAHPLLAHDPTTIVCHPEDLDAARRLLGDPGADAPHVVEPPRA